MLKKKFGYTQLDYRESILLDFPQESLQPITQLDDLKDSVSIVGEYGLIPYTNEGIKIMFSQLANWDKPRPPQFIFGAAKEVLEEYIGEVDFIGSYFRRQLE